MLNATNVYCLGTKIGGHNDNTTNVYYLTEKDRQNVIIINVYCFGREIVGHNVKFTKGGGVNATIP